MGTSLCTRKLVAIALVWFPVSAGGAVVAWLAPFLLYDGSTEPSWLSALQVISALLGFPIVAIAAVIYTTLLGGMAALDPGMLIVAVFNPMFSMPQTVTLFAYAANAALWAILIRIG
jgi:hypothetical protein